MGLFLSRQYIEFTTTTSTTTRSMKIKKLVSRNKELDAPVELSEDLDESSEPVPHLVNQGNLT
jgi:hypothetical protein